VGGVVVVGGGVGGGVWCWGFVGGCGGLGGWCLGGLGWGGGGGGVVGQVGNLDARDEAGAGALGVGQGSRKRSPACSESRQQPEITKSEYAQTKTAA